MAGGGAAVLRAWPVVATGKKTVTAFAGCTGREIVKLYGSSSWTLCISG